MKHPRTLLHGLIQLPLDPSVALVSKRIVVRLAILLFFAALPIAGTVGFRSMFIVLTGVNVIMCVIWALFRRERPNGVGLTHWDEALVMIGFWLTAHLI